MRKPQPATITSTKVLPRFDQALVAVAVGTAALSGCGDALQDSEPVPVEQASGGERVNVAIQIQAPAQVVTPQPQVVYVRPAMPVTVGGYVDPYRVQPPRVVYVEPATPPPVHIDLRNLQSGPVIVTPPVIIPADSTPHALPGAPRSVAPVPLNDGQARGGLAIVRSGIPTT